MSSKDIKDLQFSRQSPQFTLYTLLHSSPLLQPTNMFTALRTLADVAAKRAPLSSSTIAEPGSPSDMDINSSSDEYTPPSLLFKIDLDEEEEEAPSLLPLINDLFDQNKPKYQQAELPLVKNLTNIMPTDGLWSINREEAMAMLTKAIDDSRKRSPRHLYKMYSQLKRLADTNWSVPPYEDWTPSQCTWDNAQPPPRATNSSSTTLVSSEDKDEDPQIGVLDAWPSPPPSPIHSNGMHPPNIELSGENPGEPWIFNTIGSPDYFRLLIPDPAMPHEQIVAPWIKYDLTIAQPEIAGTFGKNYPITLRGLRRTPVDYICPTLTPSQLEVLDSKAQCGEVINWILAEHCPKDLLAGVLTYRHYQEAQYATQRQINALQERHMYYLERRMEALSALENANVLGRILAHIEDFKGYPEAYATFFHAVAPFHSHIMYSGTNTAIDRYMSGAIALSLPASACTPAFTPIRIPCPLPTDYANQIRVLHNHTCDIHKYQNRKPTPPGPRSNKSKRCHKCHQLRHIRRECPHTKKVFRFK